MANHVWELKVKRERERERVAMGMVTFCMWEGEKRVSLFWCVVQWQRVGGGPKGSTVFLLLEGNNNDCFLLLM